MKHCNQRGTISHQKILESGLIFLIILCHRSAPATAEPLTEDDRNQLTASRIVTNIINDFPPNVLNVYYPKSNYRPDFGRCCCRPSNIDVTSTPQVSFQNESSEYSTLLMIDPDAPSPDFPFLSPIFHWGLCNIKGNDISTGEEIVSYQSPSPPSCAPHRYIFLLYSQSVFIENCDYKVIDVPSVDRENFSYKQYAERKGLKSISHIQFFYAHRCVWDLSNQVC